MAQKYIALLALVLLIGAASWVAQSQQILNKPQKRNQKESMNTDQDKLEKATFGAGCFWCTEAVFQRLKGVHKVESGYAGGHTENPTYRDICTGTTGHAEVAQITFDPNEISYEDLLYVFWRTHDPTTLNRQGNDVGTQYRSVVFYHNQAQKKAAEKSKTETNLAKVWKNPIVTEISPIPTFYKAEGYHQDYYNQNKKQGYCVYVIDPKIQKLNKDFKEKLKPEYIDAH